MIGPLSRHALRAAGDHALSHQHFGFARNESDAARYFFAWPHRNDEHDRGLSRRPAVLAATTFAPAIAVIVGTGASGRARFVFGGSLFRSGAAADRDFLSSCRSRQLLRYGVSISAYDLINSLIVRLDVIMLGFFIGRAPGVTLPTVGVYGTVVEVAGGLRKVNQAFNPIFAPDRCRPNDWRRTGARRDRFARVAQWTLWVFIPIARGDVARRAADSRRNLRRGFSAGQHLARSSSRSPAPRTRSSRSPRPSSWCKSRSSICSIPRSPASSRSPANLWLIASLRSDRRGLWNSAALCAARRAAASGLAPGLSLAQSLARSLAAARRRACSR